MAETKMIVKDLGEVTAYAYAVSKGYTGTEEEFATLMASYATVGQQAVDAKNAAVTARNEAEAAKNESVAAKDEAVQAAGDAAKNAKDTIDQILSDVADNIEQIDQNTLNIADLKETTEDLEDRKANIDGSYPDMTVGNAEQLNSSKYVENSEPYTLRTSSGSADIGNREYVDAVVGGTLAWNQEVRDEASENSTDFADVVTVTDAVEDAAEVRVKLEPVQDLHGYDHPWPAGGGVNLLHVDSRVSATVASVTYTSDDDYVYLNGTKYGQGYTTLTQLPISLEPGTYYARAFAVGGTSTNRIYLYVNNGDVDLGGDILAAERTFTIAETTTFVFRFLIGTDGAVFSNYKIGIVISKTSGIDVFSPYSNICPITGWDGVQIVVSPTADAADGQTYSIALPTEAGTVYGGELTVNADGSGSLVVDRKNIVYDGSNNYTWTYVSNCHCMICGNEISDIEYGVSIVDYQNSYGIIVHRTSMNAKQLQFGSSQKPIEAIAPSVEEWKAKLNENPIQLVYLLATPITYTLTASQIRTLLGTNNVWSDAGQLALTYTGTDEHLTLESGKKYLARLSGTDSMLLGSGQEITAAKGTDNVFDLTQMFGTDVADYVYGQGAAFFRKWFPNAVYLHNAGELKHVEGLQSHDMVGFNAWDSSTDNIGKSIAANGDLQNSTNYATSDYISVFPNTTYYLKNVAPSANARTIYCYDASKNPIRDLGLSGAQNAPASGLITTVDNTHYVRIVRFVTTTEYGISLSHNGSRNGEYEPYEKHSYPLDSSVILRGIPKVGANGVYWDGDRYLPDGTIERRYGVVDLGTLNWTKHTNVEPVRFYSVVSDGLVPSTSPSGTGDGACSKYRIIPRGVTSTMSDKSMFVGSSFVSLDRFSVVIRDDELSGLSQQQFKAAMSGVLLVYKLNTPTTETAQPYHSTQWVSDWGTEEFVSTGIVPVGHETRYPANLRDKLQHLPDAASGNGSYLITQTDGQMVLTPFPAPPSTAGNYVLKATVTNGVATYTWEVAT